LKDLAALGLESGGVTLLPFFIHVSSIKNLNIELKDLAALGLESGGVTLLPFFIHVSSIKNLNIEYNAKDLRQIPQLVATLAEQALNYTQSEEDPL
jgi:hypothetical protein